MEADIVERATLYSYLVNSYPQGRNRKMGSATALTSSAIPTLTMSAVHFSDRCVLPRHSAARPETRAPGLVTEGDPL